MPDDPAGDRRMTITKNEPRLSLMQLSAGPNGGEGLLFAVGTSACAGHPMREAVNLVVLPHEAVERGDWVVASDGDGYALTRATADGRANAAPGVVGAVVRVEILHSGEMGEFLTDLVD